MKYFYIVLLIFFFPSDSFSKMYKCTDSGGKTIYQTHDCEEGSDSEVISKKEFDVDYKPNKNKYEGFDGFGNGKSDNLVRDFRKIEKISSGEKINLKRYLVSGVITAFYFYADWCGSCKLVGPRAEKKVESSNDIALRKIDITKSDSPVKKQYGVKSIPYFIIYDKDGREISRGNSLKF